VINAFADCGSYTSWSIHDSVQLENAAVATAASILDKILATGGYFHVVSVLVGKRDTGYSAVDF
jgi:hypothetical protein